MKKSQKILIRQISCFLLFVSVLTLSIFFRDALGKPLTVIIAMLSFIPVAVVTFPPIMKRDRETLLAEAEAEQSLENYRRREEHKNRTL